MGKKTNKQTKPTKEARKLVSEYKSDFEALKTTHSELEAKEKILMSVSGSSVDGSRVVDPTLLSAVLKQNNETVAKEPTGKITAMSNASDRGKVMFMDLLFRNYILPNANTQNNAFTKFWMLGLYRDVYGSSFALVDLASNTKKTGADFTLLHPRSVVPQKGRYSVQDSEYMYVRSKVSKSWLKNRDKDIWKDIDEVLDNSSGLDYTQNDYTSYNQDKYESGSFDKNNTDIELITKYYPDRWVTFHAPTNVVVRDIPNPQDNDEIPIVKCDAYPLMDRFFGLGEFERGSTLHNAAGSLINMYLMGIKMSLYPPLMVDLDGVVARTIKMSPGAKWVMKANRMDAVQQFQTSPQGLNTFQSTYGFLKGAILTMTNTTDTSVSESVDAGMGKTPQALKMQQAMQDMKLNFKRRMFDEAVEGICNKLIDVFVARNETPVELDVFGKDLERIQQYNPDVLEMFGVDQGRLVVNPEDIEGIKYRFEIDAGSTAKKDQITENQTLTQMIEMLFQIPGAVEQIMQTGYVQVGEKRINGALILSQWFQTSGVDNADQMVEDAPQQQANFEDPMMAQQFAGGGVGGLDPQQQQLLMEVMGNGGNGFTR